MCAKSYLIIDIIKDFFLAVLFKLLKITSESNASSSACCSGDKPLYRFSKYSARSSGVSSGSVNPAISVGNVSGTNFPCLVSQAKASMNPIMYVRRSFDVR